MWRTVLFVFLFIVLLPDVYVWFIYLSGASSAWRLLHWLPLALLLSLVVTAFRGVHREQAFRLSFVILLALDLPRAVFMLCDVAGRILGWLCPAAATVGAMVGLCTAAVLLCAAACGFVWGWRRLSVRYEDLTFHDLPSAFDGYRIVHLSDLHVGTLGRKSAFVHRIVACANALRPDLILFTGDLVNSDADEVTPYAPDLASLSAPDGVFAVLGNHDYCEYRTYAEPDGAARNMARVAAAEHGVGWQLLRNAHMLIRRGEDVIAVVGVDNDSRPPFPAHGDLSRALSGLPSAVFKMLLTHDPSHWRRAVLPETDVRLTFSGHTHAMQLQLGRFSPARFVCREWGGLYEEGGRRLCVSKGLGGSVAFRLGAWPEIVVVTLQCASAGD